MERQPHIEVQVLDLGQRIFENSAQGLVAKMLIFATAQTTAAFGCLVVAQLRRRTSWFRNIFATTYLGGESHGARRKGGRLSADMLHLEAFDLYLLPLAIGSKNGNAK